MLFVQEEKLVDLEKDINNENSYLDFSLNITSNLIDKITSEYYTYLPIFKSNKEKINVEYILGFIGNSY